MTAIGNGRGLEERLLPIVEEGGASNSRLGLVFFSSTDVKTISASRGVFNALIGLGAGVCQVPFIKLNDGVLPGRAWYAILATGNSVSFGLVYAWSGIQIARQILSQQDPLALERSEPNKKFLKLVTAVAGGIISQIPSAYIVYKHNGDDGPVMASMIFLVHTWMPIYSVLLGLNNQGNKNADDGTEKTRSRLLTSLEQFITNISDPSFALSTCERIKVITNEQAEEVRVNELSKLIFVKPQGSQGQTVCEANSKYPGYFFFAVIMVYLGILGVEGGELISDNVAWLIILATVVVSSNAYLFLDVMPASSQSAANDVLQLFSANEKSIDEQISPVLSKALQSAAILFPAFAFGPTITACRSEIDQHGEEFSLFMQVTVVMGIFLFLKMILNLASKDLLREVNKRTGSENQQILLNIEENANLLKEKIKTCSKGELNSILSEIAQEVKTLLEIEEALL